VFVVADRRCAARIRGPCPGWLVLGVSTHGWRVYRCAPCRVQCRPLLDLLGVKPGRISGSLARWLALLPMVAPYPLATRLAWSLLGVNASRMGVWRAAQRLGQAAANYSEKLSVYHADSRSPDVLHFAGP